MPSESGKKTMLMIILTVCGIVGLFYFLMPGVRVQTPQNFDEDFYQQPEVARLVAAINSDFADQWQEEGIEHARPVNDDLRLARRLSLGLMGTVPSLEELRAFEQQPTDQRINWWISRILEDRRSSDYIAERLARAYVGVEDGPFVIFRRRKFVSWLSDQVHANVGYDKIVQALLSDEGLWTDSPAVNFMTVTTNEETSSPDPIRLASRTTRAFLGMRIDCLQCHDDFLGEIELGDDLDSLELGDQEHFHELAAFFGQVQNSAGGVRDSLHSEEYQYMFLDEEEPRAVVPSVPYGSEFLEVDDRLRSQLTKWVTHKKNRPFARAIVNRMWAIVCGQALTEPIDNISLGGPFPPGMELLVDDLIKHDFDLKRLVRIIVACKPFQLESEAEFELTRAHEKYWAVFPVTRLRPEQVAGSIIQATSLTTIDSTASIFSQINRYGLEGEFVERYGDWGEEEFSDRGATVAQRLLMLNGELVSNRVSELTTSPQQVAALSPDRASMIETAYLTTLTRRPVSEETDYFINRLEADANQEQDLIRDLYWILINSKEFSWNY